MDDVKATSKNWSAKTDSGFVRLEYIGKNRNELTFNGPTGRRYRFGNNEYHRFGLVHQDDVHWALRLNCFRVADQPPPSGESAPLHAEPSPKPSPVSALTSTSKDDTLVPEGAGLNLSVGARSIKELQGMDLTKYDLVTAIRLEEAGKNRKSALTLLGRAQRRLASERKKVTPSDEPVDVLSKPVDETHEETPDEDVPDEDVSTEHVPDEDVLTDEIADENIEDVPPDQPTTPEVTYAKSVYGNYTIPNPVR